MRRGQVHRINVAVNFLYIWWLRSFKRNHRKEISLLTEWFSKCGGNKTYGCQINNFVQAGIKLNAWLYVCIINVVTCYQLLTVKWFNTDWNNRLIAYNTIISMQKEEVTLGSDDVWVKAITKTNWIVSHRNWKNLKYGCWKLSILVKKVCMLCGDHVESSQRSFTIKNKLVKIHYEAFVYKNSQYLCPFLGMKYICHGSYKFTT